jgi:alpha-amylase/alpha-mannosidase (GH57 family)
MADIVLSFLWHQHQPYYPDDVAGENPMPWVRLHGVKDYYGMALHLLEYPEMRCTINLVPSLLVQLLAYAEGKASDQFLDVSRIPADGLREADCLFLLDHFFMANHDQMIGPHSRFAELLALRGVGRSTAREALRRFRERDLRDLQVWHNLAWIHPLAVAQDECLRGLMERDRNFSEEDKDAVLSRQREILGRILPLHRELADRGQVELTTTPFYHPILPLLFDKKLAREAMPDVKLPRYTGGYPEDAAVQAGRAVEQHARLFGQPPRGMWPAEGSVCQEMLPLLAQHGVRWIATDEEVLSASTQGEVSRDAKGYVRHPERMYAPYRVREGDAELSIVFRDHALSDLIGFHYQRSEPTAAAEHFLGNLHGIGRSIQQSHPALVSVILDGENCWEHYPGAGVDFLRALYARCTSTPGLAPMTVGEYLDRYPPRATLPHLFAGSWINHNFAIWIGHEEDNTAWDAIQQTREFLRGRIADCGLRIADSRTEPGERGCVSAPSSGSGSAPSVPVFQSAIRNPQSAIERAWEEIYIAEGSDWFWWYGDDHSSAQDEVFDYLFRKHLQNVYLLLGETPPVELGRPIRRRGQRVICSQPRAFLEVKIDGRYTFFEWVAAGRYTCQNERGTMALAAQGPLKEVYFGFNLQQFLVRIDCEGPARSQLAGCEQLRVVFVEPAGYEVRLHNPGRKDQRLELVAPDNPTAQAAVQVGLDQVFEMSVPFDWLGVQVGQPLQFFVEVLDDGQSRDRAPREGVISLARPGPEFELRMWNV